MSSDWANFERESIKQTGQSGQPTLFQEFGISFLASRMQSSTNQREGVTDEIEHQILESGQSPNDAWYDFLNLVFSAASSTSSDSTHGRLVELIFGLANHFGRQNTTNPSQDQAGASVAEVDGLFKNLTGFGWIARDLWNGPRLFIPTHGSSEASQKAWVNLNRFVAHLSCQQRRTPVAPLHEFLEDFGLWNIADGLEDKAGSRDNGGPAAVWLIIAGPDIYSDLTWGKRDGNPSPGIPLREGSLWSSRLAAGATQEMRWDFWKERLLKIMSDESLDVSTREMAQQAERAMDEIELVSRGAKRSRVKEP